MNSKKVKLLQLALIATIFLATWANQSDYASSLRANDKLNPQCIEVEGDLVLWNGWPPNARIRDPIKNLVYGIPEAETDVGITKELTRELSSKGFATGIFCLSLLNQTITLPYQEEHIHLATIQRYKLFP